MTKKDQPPAETKNKQITISARALDDLARLSGYEGEEDPHVFGRLNVVLNREGQERFAEYARSYIEGIGFLNKHKSGFTGQDIVVASMRQELTGPGLAALAQVFQQMSFGPKSEIKPNQVCLFIDSLLPPK